MNKGAIMKTKNVVKYLIVISFILSSSYVISEESGDIYVGANFGQNRNHSSSRFYNTGNVPDDLKFCELCFSHYFDEVFKNYSGGFNIEYVLFTNNIWSNNLTSSFRFTNYNYQSNYQFFIETIYENPESYYGFSEIYTKVDTKLKIDMFMIDLDLLYKIKFNTFVQFGLNVGPYFSIPASIKATENISIKKAYNYSEEVLKHDTLPERDLVYDVKNHEIKPYWGIRSNLFLEYEFLESFKATAEVGFSYPLSYLKKDIMWDITSEYVNFRISYKLK